MFLVLADWTDQGQAASLAGFGVLENEYQRGHDNDGRDDLPSGRTPLLFARGFDSFTIFLPKVTRNSCPGLIAAS